MQKHIIKRQIIELTVPDGLKAQPLQAEVSRIYRQRLVPLLDQLCSELSAPDRIHRIERLEIDLGQLDPAALEGELVARARQALRQALAQEIKRQDETGQPAGQQPQARSQLELLAFFLRTGSLPWWAEADQPQLLDDCLAYLFEVASEPLRRLLEELVRDQRALQRLVSHYDDTWLARLAGLLVPALKGSDSEALLWLLPKTEAGSGRSLARLRQSLWPTILAVAALLGETWPGIEPFYQAVLRRIATGLGTTYASLISDLHHHLPAVEQTLSPTFKATLQALYQEYRGTKATSEGPAALEAALRLLISQLPSPVQAELQTLLRPWEGDPALGAETIPAVLRRIFELLQPGLTGQPLLSPLHRDLLAVLQKLAGGNLPPSERSTLIETLRQALNKARVSPLEKKAGPLDLSFSEAEEIYLQNAGLVILWPFLGHFLERLELLTERQFKDAVAQQRAVGLLQYLASGETLFPEYLLPLNKVLCGLELAELFEFDLPLSEAEAEEGNNLLSAVIAQAPILRDMSVPAFRGTFLLRRGMLSARDGAWLLRVERESYDIVLERFPWSWGWVKLPWMAAPLRVEW